MPNIEPFSPTSLAEVDLRPRGPVHPSPFDWRDQVLYFLLLDRFSDGQEDGRPRFDPANPEQFRAADPAGWRRRGKDFVGGTLKGIAGKLDYLQNLGVTALWIGPVWKQRLELDTYHGYGIQNFLEIDPRFGTRQDLRDLVDAAHARGMYVLLDIFYNHTGNNWFYDRDGSSQTTLPYRFSPPYPFGDWRSATGNSIPDIHDLDDGIWPVEFQKLEWYTRAGQIGKWDPDAWEGALHPDNEFRRGDFFDLKDLNLSRDEALSAVIRAYQYWIALSDCDGFRIDTVKHIPWEASKNFCGAIREYTEMIGKENFWLLGEVTGGGELTRNYLDIFGRNIDAALDIGEPATLLAGMVKGQVDARAFFSQFGGHNILGGHRETGRYHVSILDDHDMVGRAGKHRFSAHNQIPTRFEQVAHTVGAQLTTLGVPCIYYGTEQAFDGTEARGDPQQDGGFEDRYIREAMFGGAFGAFETQGCHFFNPEQPTYLRIAAIARIRNQPDQVGQALRRGRQYQRQTAFQGANFVYPGPGELIAWSRLLHQQEVLVTLNGHGTQSRGADVTVDSSLHPPGSEMRVLYRSDWSDADLWKAGTRQAPLTQPVSVRYIDGRATVRVDLPPAGMSILA